MFAVQRDVPVKDTRSLSSRKTAAAELFNARKSSSPESSTGNASILPEFILDACMCVCMLSISSSLTLFVGWREGRMTCKQLISTVFRALLKWLTRIQI